MEYHLATHGNLQVTHVIHIQTVRFHSRARGVWSSYGTRRKSQGSNSGVSLALGRQARKLDGGGGAEGGSRERRRRKRKQVLKWSTKKNTSDSPIWPNCDSSGQGYTLKAQFGEHGFLYFCSGRGYHAVRLVDWVDGPKQETVCAQFCPAIR